MLDKKLSIRDVINETADYHFVIDANENIKRITQEQAIGDLDEKPFQGAMHVEGAAVMPASKQSEQAPIVAIYADDETRAKLSSDHITSGLIKAHEQIGATVSPMYQFGVNNLAIMPPEQFCNQSDLISSPLMAEMVQHMLFDTESFTLQEAADKAQQAIAKSHGEGFLSSNEGKLIEPVDEVTKAVSKACDSFGSGVPLNNASMMNMLNHLVEGHGVEPVYVVPDPDNPSEKVHLGHIINTGDAYTPTLFMDNDSQITETTLGDIVEMWRYCQDVLEETQEGPRPC